ncbi:hypothetical protein QUA00_35930 [Microcoleus sp. T2B6]|uniref:hypothetical protein n=1 Tax=Microcoleus sp. T2B6 TaxID=3055424 RepID=UPI002FCEBC2D
MNEMDGAIANRSLLQPQFSTSDRCTPEITHALQRQYPGQFLEKRLKPLFYRCDRNDIGA